MPFCYRYSKALIQIFNIGKWGTSITLSPLKMEVNLVIAQRVYTQRMLKFVIERALERWWAERWALKVHGEVLEGNDGHAFGYQRKINSSYKMAESCEIFLYWMESTLCERKQK